MYLYDLDSKISSKSYELLNSHIEEAKYLKIEKMVTYT